MNERYRKRLIELEKTLAARTDRALADARDQHIDSAHDTGDSSVADVAAEDSFLEAEQDSATLEKVRSALARIENGTYGKCVVDGGPIEAKRLDAVPWAEHCLKHAEAIGGE